MIRLSLRVARADAELVLADLLDLAPAGVEEIELPGRDGGEAQVEYAIYGPPGELPELPELQALAGGVRVELSSGEVPEDWAERWKRFHRPVLVESSSVLVPSLHVRPPWEAALERDDVCEIAIDPAQAFGTGAHATTRLCLELMVALADEDAARGAVVDVGTGSGVLAIAAAKLGYGPVLALDNDPLSVAATRANAEVAGVELDIRRHDLRSATPSAAIVLANLLHPLLLELAGSIESVGGQAVDHLIASGLLREEADEVAGLYAERLGLRERERRGHGDWAALWLTRR